MYPRSYGEYVLLERIGTGGMSEVDLARKGADLDFVRFLVIKRIKADRVDDDTFVRMFKDEARITSELHHENIAQVYDFGRVGDEYYLALEYVPGLDVRRIVNSLREKKQRVPLNITFRILIDVLEGLHYAHTKVDTLGQPMNIVHRDVNPRNIMVSVRGDVKLIDFGVARATNRLERTKTDHVKGKFAYMAPEQINAAEEVDGRVDLFAVGLTLHEMLTGYGPFYGLSQMQIMHRLLAGKVPSLDVPPDYPDREKLLAVHAKALAFKPEERYATAKDFAKALEDVAAAIGGPATRQEMVAFLARVKPTLQKEVRDKLHSYSGPVDISHLRAQAADAEGSMSGVTNVGTSTLTIGPRGVVAAGGLLGVGMALVVVALVLALVFVLANKSGDEPVAAGPISIGQPSAVVPLPAPVEPLAVEPEPVAVEPEPAVVEPEPVAPEPVVPAPVLAAPKPAAPKPVVPAPVPVAPEPVAVQPEPVVEPAPEPEPVVEPAPEPEPAVVVAPVPAVFGQLQVTSGVSGRVISIDGVATEYKTPAKFRWPVGDHSVTVDGYADPKKVAVREGQSATLIFRD